VTSQAPAAVQPDRLSRINRALPKPLRTALNPLARYVRARQAGPPSLDEIGLRTGTDKASDRHGYLLAYENIVGHLRNEKFQLVEIGIFKGASVRMWEAFFQRADILGVDYHAEYLKETYLKDAGARIKVVVGDQGSPEFLSRFAAEIDPLIIVDDGSHIWEHQINTFRALFGVLRPGGFYFLEDIQTSFGAKYIEHYGRGYHESAFDYMDGIAEGIVAAKFAEPARDDFETYCRKNIESLTYVKHGIIVRKRLVPLR
jgi:hypothetical protein